MNRILGAAGDLWQMRRSEDRSTRLRWWLCAVLLLGTLFFIHEPGAYLRTVWNVYNVGLGIVSFAWMLLHPRSLGTSSETAMAWSRWLTALAAVLLYLNVQTGTSGVTTGIALLIVVAASPFIFVCLLMFSFFGASLGAFRARRLNNAEREAISAVSGWWLSILMVAGLSLIHAERYLSGPVIVALFVGTPTFSPLVGRLIDRVFLSRDRLPYRLVEAALHRLVLKRSRTDPSRTLDLRGVAIGLITAIIVLTIGRWFIGPAQQSAMASLFRLREQLSLSISTPDAPAGRILLAKLDAESRAEALTSSSEAAMQAHIIERAGAAGAAAIVLPAPTIEAPGVSVTDTDQQAVAHTIRDLPLLVNAVRQSRNVILVASTQQLASRKLAPLVAAARTVALFGVERYGPARLTTVPLTWDRYPPAPLAALAAANGQPLAAQVIAADSTSATIAGEPIPMALTGRAVLDLRSSKYRSVRRDAVPSIPYSGVLAEKGDVQRRLAGTVVVLQPLVEEDVETLSGVMSRYELLAVATNSLIHHGALEPGSRAFAIVGTLAICIMIGAICVGRDPLQASWRAAILILLVLVYSITAYLVLDLWADPVTPLVSAALAYLLVTQLTFSLERNERERNRALFSRFVAREFVDELLQSHAKMPALGGEKRNVCVLFADVRNFTGFAESHSPEVVIEIMNIYLTALTDALDEYGGLLDKYTGDGLMAFFEVRDDVRADLTRSVRAALAMRDGAISVSNRLQSAGRTCLEIGIGMHYGEAIVGLVGNEQRQINYTALGHTVVVSARLQTLAEGGDVVVSEPIYAQVRDLFRFTPMPPVFVKGVSAEQRPYRVHQAHSLEAGEQTA